MGEMVMARAQKRTDLPGRTLVRNSQDRTGVVVGSLLPPQDLEPVLVEFDDSPETQTVVGWKELNVLGRLSLKNGLWIECLGCVFSSGRICLRYFRPASSFIPKNDQRKPTRIFPHCLTS